MEENLFQCTYTTQGAICDYFLSSNDFWTDFDETSHSAPFPNGSYRNGICIGLGPRESGGIQHILLSGFFDTSQDNLRQSRQK